MNIFSNNLGRLLNLLTGIPSLLYNNLCGVIRKTYGFSSHVIGHFKSEISSEQVSTHSLVSTLDKSNFLWRCVVIYRRPKDVQQVACCIPHNIGSFLLTRGQQKMFSVIIINGLQRGCRTIGQRQSPCDNSVSIQKCIFNWPIPLEKCLIRNTSFFFYAGHLKTLQGHTYLVMNVYL